MSISGQTVKFVYGELFHCNTFVVAVLRPGSIENRISVDIIGKQMSLNGC